METIEPGLIMGITFGVILIVVTGIAIYTSFGPPSAELSDPFEDHED